MNLNDLEDGLSLGYGRIAHLSAYWYCKPVEANEVTSVFIPGMVGSKDAGC